MVYVSKTFKKAFDQNDENLKRFRRESVDTHAHHFAPEIPLPDAYSKIIVLQPRGEPLMERFKEQVNEMLNDTIRGDGVTEVHPKGDVIADIEIVVDTTFVDEPINNIVDKLKSTLSDYTITDEGDNVCVDCFGATFELSL